MGSVYGAPSLPYGGFAPRAAFAPTHHHYIAPTQRADSGRLEVVGPETAAHRDLLLLATEARGTAIELMAPHHARHHALAHHHHHHHHHHRRSVSGVNPGVGGGHGAVPHHGVGVARSRSFVRQHRWPHLHHIHQGGGGGGGLLAPAHLQQIHVASIAPPPTYQVFLNLLAMFPVAGSFGSGSERDSPPAAEPENYEALLTLAERLGEAKPRGLQRHEIDTLPSYKYSEPGDGEQTSCVVCMCEFEARQTLRVLPCAHEFHARCVDKWLRSNRTCPICRGNASDYLTSTGE